MITMNDLAGQPAARFVRHRDSMLLLDRLLEMSPEHAVCSWRVPDSHPIFGASEEIPGYVAIECMAQCVAVHAGAMAALKNQGPPLGLLLGTRQFSATQTHLDRGSDFLVKCRELLRDTQGMASFECEIRKHDFVVAKSRLAVFEYLAGTESDESIQ